MRKIFFSLILVLIASVSFAQVKKVEITTKSVQYGTQENHKGLDFWKMDGDAIPSEISFVIKNNIFTSKDNGIKTPHTFKEETEFSDNYTEITFTLICEDGYEYHVKIDRINCRIGFAHYNGTDWRLTRYGMESIVFK